MAKKSSSAPTKSQTELETMLHRLGLLSIRDRLDSLLDEASRKELNLRESLQFLCDVEIDRRNNNRVQMGLKIAKFPFARSLENFEFEAQPSLDPKQVRELATSRWVGNGDSLVLLGPPGVGKTHLAVALGREALPCVPQSSETDPGREITLAEEAA